ncbi:MAG TPA: phosphate ABC transporter substrate-binding protein PstS, partial [Verrucomicrobiae bacterium]|nr:phosphate ABC transporter substrate-binding protein PstS [Verrucomicrobiae bacterium]
SIGYIELIYAVQNKILYGRVKNSAGAFVKAELPSVSAAAAAASKSMPEDFRVSITNPPADNKAAYPISSFTWLLIPSKINDASKRDAVKGFLKWMMTDGQQYCEPLAYAKLPKEVVAKELKAVDKIQ